MVGRGERNKTSEGSKEERREEKDEWGRVTKDKGPGGVVEVILLSCITIISDMERVEL